MRPELWQLHHWHQMEGAYPNGPQVAPTCHIKTAEPWLREGNRHYQDALVLGPGTFHEPDELSVCARIDLKRLTLLTLFAGELNGLREAHYDVVLGDFHDMPFESGRFDLVFSSNVMEHAMSPYIALMECRRVLQDGGVFYMIVPEFNSEGGGHTPWHLYCFEQPFWCELLRKTGLSVNLCRRVFQPEVGPRESYLHIRATAVELPEPHDEAMRKLIALKEPR